MLFTTLEAHITAASAAWCCRNWRLRPAAPWRAAQARPRAVTRWSARSRRAAVDVWGQAAVPLRGGWLACVVSGGGLASARAPLSKWPLREVPRLGIRLITSRNLTITAQPVKGPISGLGAAPVGLAATGALAVSLMG